MGISPESLSPALPLVGLAGIFFSLDYLAGREREVMQEYRALLKQALVERRRATQRLIDGWRRLADPLVQEDPGDVIEEFWQRVGEIEEREQSLHTLFGWYKWIRQGALLLIVVGVTLSFLAFFPLGARPYLFWMAVAAGVITLVAAVVARLVGAQIDAFGSHAMFRRG